MAMSRTSSSAATKSREKPKPQSQLLRNLAQYSTNSVLGLNGKETVPFTVKGPIPVHLQEPGTERPSLTRCSIIDLTFQYPCQIGELVFTNYYTAWLSIYVKRTPPLKKSDQADSKKSKTKSRHVLERSFSVDVNDPSLSPPTISGESVDVQEVDDNYESKLVGQGAQADAEDDQEAQEPTRYSGGGTSGTSRKASSTSTTTMTRKLWSNSSFPRRHSSGSLNGEKASCPDSSNPWELSVEMKNLMPWPHYENGSQDLVSIPATESLSEWRDVSAMRLVLHQPSSVWKKFTLEEIDVFRQLPKRGYSHCTDLLRQRDNWFSMLRLNTKTMLSGQVVEPENASENASHTC